MLYEILCFIVTTIFLILFVCYFIWERTTLYKIVKQEGQRGPTGFVGAEGKRGPTGFQGPMGPRGLDTYIRSESSMMKS